MLNNKYVLWNQSEYDEHRLGASWHIKLWIYDFQYFHILGLFLEFYQTTQIIVKPFIA